jgi:hypothetical protein
VLQGLQVVDIETREHGKQLVPQTATALGRRLLEQEAVGRGRGGEAPRNGDTDTTQLAEHLSEGGILATDLGQRVEAQALEGKHQRASPMRPIHGPGETEVAATVTTSEAVDGPWCTAATLFRLLRLQPLC